MVVLLGEQQCHLKICSGRLKVKVTTEGQMIELVRAISSTFMHGFQNNMPQLCSLRSKSAI